MVWIDEDHLAADLVFFCDSPGMADRKVLSEIAVSEIAVFDMAGHVRSVVEDEFHGFVPGPSGTLLVVQGSEADLLDHDLVTRQTLKCPVEKVACAGFVSPSRSLDSDFALCSYTATDEICRYFRGLPSGEFLERKLTTTPSHRIPTDPYKRESSEASGPVAPDGREGWMVSSSEVWYFSDHGRLMSQHSNETAPVTTENWTPDYGDCTGNLSVSQPVRFLATCVGAHFYTDGAFDALFGYSRVALFDVASRRILARIDGPSYTSAILSPSGQVIAVEHEERIRLYRVK